MATPPELLQLKKEDFPSDGLGTQPALEKFFVQFNRFSEATRKALAGGISTSDNLAWEVRELKVTTPSSVWVAPTLAAGVTNFTGFTAGYWKDGSGVVRMRGLLTRATIGDLFTLPAGYRPGDQQLDFATAISTGGTEGHGRLRVRTDGIVSIQGASAPSTWGSIDCAFSCADLSPGVLSCFPLDFTLQKVEAPVGLLLLGCRDVTPVKTGGNGSDLALSLGQPKWSALSSKRVRIQNLPGLLLGRTYTLTVAVVPR
jgi:hypothetical protein